MKYFILFIFACSYSIGLNAQDFIYSQFENSPLLLGPQMAVANNGIAIQHRSQGSLHSLPGYHDYNLTANKNIPVKKNLIGIGMSMAYGKYSDIWRDKSLAISLAHQLHLMDRDSLHIKLYYGAEAKYQITDIEERDIRWPSQIPFPQEPAPTESVNDVGYFDLSIGTALQASYRKAAFVLGYTMLHINRPQYKFISTNYTKPIRHQFFILGNIPLTSAISLVPKLAYTKFNGLAYFNTGVNFAYALSSQHKLLIGGGKTSNLYYVFAGLNFRQYSLGLSYDFPNSQQHYEIKAIEVSLNYKFGK